jgi:hypothetical protein
MSDTDLPISLGILAGELAVFSMMTSEIDVAMTHMVSIPPYMPERPPPRKVRRAHGCGYASP